MEFDFDANKNVDVIDVVPEMYRPVYIETDGGFTVNPALKPLVDAYNGVNKALKLTTQSKKAVSDEAAQRRVALKAVQEAIAEFGIEGDDLASALKERLSDLTAKVSGGKTVQIDMAKLKAEAEQRITATVAGEKAKTAKMKGALERHLIDKDLLVSMDKHGCLSSNILLPHVKQFVKVIEEMNGDETDYHVRVIDEVGAARGDGKGGWMNSDALVAELKTRPEFAPFFRSELPAGSGAAPGSMARKTVATKRELTTAEKLSAGLAQLVKTGGGK